MADPTAIARAVTEHLRRVGCPPAQRLTIASRVLADLGHDPSTVTLAEDADPPQVAEFERRLRAAMPDGGERFITDAVDAVRRALETDEAALRRLGALNETLPPDPAVEREVDEALAGLDLTDADAAEVRRHAIAHRTEDR